MKKVRSIHIIAVVKREIAKCSIITNPNCGKHKPSNYGRKHKSVLYDITKAEKQRKGKETVQSSVKSRNETLIPKATGPTNAGKKTLAATLQVSHRLFTIFLSLRN